MGGPCPECGLVNDESANFCQRCGAQLTATAQPESETATYVIDETGEFLPVELGEVTARGPALVIRAGGGREGESLPVTGDRATIGRRPESDLFLDDVTVSRDHALIIRRGDEWHVDDCGSLNGTYVNRERIDSQQLREGDELQIGKYRLSFHAR